MAKRGQAATAKELQKWTFHKLINEIKKQIRRDVGGGQMLTHYIKEARAAGITSNLQLTASLMAKAADEACTGSRSRITSKLVELLRRAKVLNP